MNNPFFSIIIPTFNSAKTLSACLDSILNQTFKQIEIVIVDNISTDETIIIVDKYASLGLNINLICEKDKGIYDAMNKGIKLAKGKWLYLVGSDDVLYHKDIFTEVEKELFDFDVIYGNVFSTRFGGLYDGEFTNLKLLEKNICHQAIIFNKKVFNKIGLFDLKIRVHADWDHNFRWFLSEKVKKKYIQKTIAIYADGGFSSITDDSSFGDNKFWKFSLLTKNKLKRKERYYIAKEEYNKKIFLKKRREAAMILFQTLFYLI